MSTKQFRQLAGLFFILGAVLVNIPYTLLIMNFDGSDHQFLAALDKQTGQTRWRHSPEPAARPSLQFMPLRKVRL